MSNEDFQIKRIGASQTIEKVASGEDKRVSRSVGIILLVLLIASITFGARRQSTLKIESAESELASEVEHRLSEAESIFSLNPERARELVLEAEGFILTFEKEHGPTKALNEAKKDLAQYEQLILGEFEAEVRPFFDFSLISQDFSGSDLKSHQNTIFIFDANTKRLVSIEMATKRSEIVAGRSKLEGASEIIPYSGGVFYTTDEGVFSLGGERLIEKSWQGKVLSEFFSGNFYIVDTEQSKVYRYRGPGDGGFGDQTSWLKNEKEEELSGAKALIIDGFLWVLNSEGKVLKFSLGNKINFNFKGFGNQSFFIEDMYTNEQLESLYFLDPSGGSIFVTDKNGEYKARYYSPDIKGAKKIVVSESVKKLFLLTSGGIFYVELEHLD